MKTIWKYPFKIDDRFSIDMPEDAKIIHVQSQNMAPHLWAMVDTEARITKRWFRIYGTGHQRGMERVDYVGTFAMAGAQLIWHLFEEL